MCMSVGGAGMGGRKWGWDTAVYYDYATNKIYNQMLDVFLQYNQDVNDDRVLEIVRKSQLQQQQTMAL
eukprot:6226854-Ditylum_brightwellii.AAC.1